MKTSPRTASLCQALIFIGLAVYNFSSAKADEAKPFGSGGERYLRSQAQYQLPELELTRQDGIKTQLATELNDGRPVILNFIFTSCTAICPLLSGMMSSLQTKLGKELDQVHMVSISIDPEYDNPERLQAYAAQFKAKSQWQFYSSNQQNLRKVQEAFDAYRGDKMNHTITTYLRVSPNQTWVRLDGFLSSDDVHREYQQLKSQLALVAN